jgi:hypothetical protein
LRAVAVVLVLGLVGLGGARPAAADVVDGTKQFKRDCTLHMQAKDGEHESHIVQDEVDVWDSGTDCLDYFIRGVSLTTDSGYHGYNSFSNSPDYEDRADLERLVVLGDYVGFRFGDADVFIPSLSRCDRYRLNDAGEVRFLDSRPCSGSRYPPRVKPFKKDCALVFDELDNRGPSADLLAKDAGTECDEYTLRGLSVVTDHSKGLSEEDTKPDADLEELSTSANGNFLYGTVNVYIPYRARCDQYRLYPDDSIRLVSSYPCPTA